VNHHGLLTGDVLFAGDSVFGEETIAKHRLLFMQDPREALQSLEKIRSLDVGTIVPAHGAPTKEIDTLVAKNAKSITAASEAIAACFERETAIDDAFARLSIDWALSANITSHHLNAATFKAHVASLQRDGVLALQTKDGLLTARRTS
jgi:glyoxylase-like metal-dependent hydrolase (beta-lactamase superfamily II)